LVFGTTFSLLVTLVNFWSLVNFLTRAAFDFIHSFLIIPEVLRILVLGTLSAHDNNQWFWRYPQKYRCPRKEASKSCFSHLLGAAFGMTRPNRFVLLCIKFPYLTAILMCLSLLCVVRRSLASALPRRLVGR
jgi:hypothetical protein